MTYFVTALTKDRAQLIAHELRTTDQKIADLAAEIWAAEGFKIARWDQA